MNGLSRRQLLGATGATALTVGAVGVATRKAEASAGLSMPTSAPAATSSEPGFDGFVNDERGEVVNITNPAYGAKGDTVLTTGGGSITALSSSFTQSGHTFVSGDVGKVVTVQGAGLEGAVLTSRIASVVSGSTVTLANPALTTVNDAGFSFGTDDTRAILAAVAAAGWFKTVYAPAGIYTIVGSSNDIGPLSGGKQIALGSRGGFVGQGGRYVPGDDTSRANTIFLCADANVGLRAEGHARYEGFMVDGNNIATAPLKTNPVTGSNVVQSPAGEPFPTGGLPTGLPTGTSTAAGAQYAYFTDVWVTRSASNGWWIFGSQNITFYDCGVTDSAQDGIYFDYGTGGHDFFNFYERGSLRYGLYCDNKSPGGGFRYLTGDINFFGGTLDGHPTRRGVTKIHNRAGLEWSFFDMDIVGDNLSGPTILLDQTLANSNIISRCRIWATPTGANPGNACIQISGTSERNGQQQMWLKTDGCAFMAGDNSVYVTQNNGFDKYSSRGWVADATTYGPAAVAHLDSDSGLPHVTLPHADVLLPGRTGRWRTANLVAPWTGTVEYRIMGEGWVQFRGSARSATGTAGRMFVLPSGYRPRDGQPVTFLVATGGVTGSEVGVGELSIQNGNPANVNAGAVSFAPTIGAPPLAGGTVVYLDGAWLSVRGASGQIW